jgi:hypothetical protein
MTAGEKGALLSYLEFNLLLLIDAHTKVDNIKLEAVDDIIEDVYDILNDLDEVLSPIAS